ncbi:glycosylphosphatidylinositol anchor biosynthesis [Agyrium rufum]|nr:glycosylphosphatidylinositol anchor biosynthesis [Agyrium rufum]
MRPGSSYSCALLTLCALLPIITATHTSNWAVLVSTSRFWFNYRHLANVLSLYRTVKRLGIPDSQIILMLPDDMACNPRNAFPGTVYNNADRALDLYGDNIEVDYRGYEVTVENFIRLLTDRLGPDVPRGKRLGSDAGSNVLVYMTGHGGNEFLKFQDSEEIGSWDLADAFQQMWEKKRYNEMLFMIDTCQANTMFSRFYSPNIIAAGSSELDQSSYSHHADQDVGVAVIDRFTYFNLDFLEKNLGSQNSRVTLGEMIDSYDAGKIQSNPGIRWDLFEGGETEGRKRLLMDFFGNVQGVEVDNGTVDSDGLVASLGNESDWQEDLRRLRAIADRNRERKPKVEEKALHRDDEDFEECGTPAMRRSLERETMQDRKLKEYGQKVVTGISWSQRALGSGVLLACLAVWGGATWLEKSP